MQTNNKSYYLFRVHSLPERYKSTCNYVMQTLVPRTSNQTKYEVLRGTNSNVYLYIKVAPTDWNTVSNYINTNQFLQRIQNGASDEANYLSIIKTEFQRYNGTQQMQNIQMNINPMMMQHNNINIHQINNNQINQMMMMQQQQMQMNQMMMQQQQQRRMNKMMMMKQQQMQMNNNFINQQNKQERINILNGLNAENCATQHIVDFFNKETILKKIKKNRQTIHALNQNKLKVYLNWLSRYIHNMYDIINNCALEADNKQRCWETNSQQITFNEATTKALLDKFARNNFLNNRNPGIDGHALIKDINDTMKCLAQCSLKIYNRQINVEDACKIMTVYDDLLKCLNQNAKAFVDRGFLGLGLNRDNGFREVMNKHAKVKNLKDVILGLIGLALGV